MLHQTEGFKMAVRLNASAYDRQNTRVGMCQVLQNLYNKIKITAVSELITVTQMNTT